MPRALCVNEDQTRKQMIDPQLEKAGWFLRDHSNVEEEIPVDGYDAEPWNGGDRLLPPSTAKRGVLVLSSTEWLVVV